MRTLLLYLTVFAWIANGLRVGPQPAKLVPLAASSSGSDCLKPTSAGYLPGTSDGDVELYYAYFEGQHINDTSPVVLWLQGAQRGMLLTFIDQKSIALASNDRAQIEGMQFVGGNQQSETAFKPACLAPREMQEYVQGGPGCASTFGMLYELGPCSVVEDGDNLELKENPGYWGDYAGLLFIDQPYGTGYSVSDHHDLIPSDVEMGTATQLYTALWNFFDKNRHLSGRPFVIAGESYGGKFVPSITHFILQAYQQPEGGLQQRQPRLRHHRRFPSDVPEPNFKLAGMAVGNGLTDPIIQETVHAEVADVFGLIDEQQKDDLEEMQDELVDLIKAHKWMKAHKLRSKIVSLITKAGGLGTLLDVRRYHDYDGKHAVDRYLNQSSVRESMQAKPHGNYASCSPEVGQVMAADAMHSVAHLVPDIVDALPCLFYQGQFDGQDGPHGNEKWLLAMEWSGAVGFSRAERSLWRIDDEVVGYERQFDNLHHVVIRNAGHMAPHDQPLVSKSLINRWLEQEVLPSSTGSHRGTEAVLKAL